MVIKTVFTYTNPRRNQNLDNSTFCAGMAERLRA